MEKPMDKQKSQVPDNKPTPAHLAATVIGPLLAAEGKSPSPADVARRLFELADAISAEQKKRAAARPPGKP